MKVARVVVSNRVDGDENTTQVMSVEEWNELDAGERVALVSSNTVQFHDENNQPLPLVEALLSLRMKASA